MRGDSRHMFAMSSCMYDSGTAVEGVPVRQAPGGGAGAGGPRGGSLGDRGVSPGGGPRWFLATPHGGVSRHPHPHPHPHHQQQQPPQGLTPGGARGGHGAYSHPSPGPGPPVVLGSGTRSAGPTAQQRRAAKRSVYKHVPHREKPVHLVQRRNARERRRVQAVNSAFVRLRRHIPYENKNKRLSKVKTLRIAIDYINDMFDMIQDFDSRNKHQQVALQFGRSPAPREGVTRADCAVRHVGRQELRQHDVNGCTGAKGRGGANAGGAGVEGTQGGPPCRNQGYQAAAMHNGGTDVLKENSQQWIDVNYNDVPSTRDTPCYGHSFYGNG